MHLIVEREREGQETPRDYPNIIRGKSRAKFVFDKGVATYADMVDKGANIESLEPGTNKSERRAIVVIRSILTHSYPLDECGQAKHATELSDTEFSISNLLWLREFHEAALHRGLTSEIDVDIANMPHEQTFDGRTESAKLLIEDVKKTSRSIRREVTKIPLGEDVHDIRKAKTSPRISADIAALSIVLSQSIYSVFAVSTGHIDHAPIAGAVAVLSGAFFYKDTRDDRRIIKNIINQNKKNHRSKREEK